MKKALIFSVSVCGLSWLVALVFHLVTGYTGPEMGQEAILTYQKFAMLYMFLPAIVAFVMRGFEGKLEIVRPHSTRIKIRINEGAITKFRPRWSWLVAILIVPLTVALSILFSSLFAEVVPMGKGTLMMLESNVSGSIPADVEAQLSALPEWIMLLATIGSGLIAGVTINAFFALGEEYGWRGYMVDALRGKQFMVAALVIGIVWGIWHAPLILMGHNYPDHRYVGIVMMVLFCLLCGVVELYFVCKSGTIWPAIFIHGTVNALAGLGILIVPEGNELLTGMTGVSGAMALAVVIGGIYIYDRFVAREYILSSTLGTSLRRHQPFDEHE